MINSPAPWFAGQTQVINEKGKKVALSLVYPPPHLYHILFELFKNSMRAVVEKNQGSSTQLPDIEVLVAKGEHDVSIRVSDQVPVGTIPYGIYRYPTNQPLWAGLDLILVRPRYISPFTPFTAL